MRQGAAECSAQDCTEEPVDFDYCNRLQVLGTAAAARCRGFAERWVRCRDFAEQAEAAAVYFEDLRAVPDFGQEISDVRK